MSSYSKPNGPQRLETSPKEYLHSNSPYWKVRIYNHKGDESSISDEKDLINQSGITRHWNRLLGKSIILDLVWVELNIAEKYDIYSGGFSRWLWCKTNRLNECKWAEWSSQRKLRVMNRVIEGDTLQRARRVHNFGEISSSGKTGDKPNGCLTGSMYGLTLAIIIKAQITFFLWEALKASERKIAGL